MAQMRPRFHQLRVVAHGDALRRVTSLLIWRILRKTSDFVLKFDVQGVAQSARGAQKSCAPTPKSGGWMGKFLT